jgi:hypothetical protein
MPAVFWQAGTRAQWFKWMSAPSRNHRQTYKVRHGVTRDHSSTFFCVRAELEYIEPASEPFHHEQSGARTTVALLNPAIKTSKKKQKSFISFLFTM